MEAGHDLLVPTEVKAWEAGKAVSLSCGANHMAVVVEMSTESANAVFESDSEACAEVEPSSTDDGLISDLHEVKKGFAQELQSHSIAVEKSSDGIKTMQDSMRAAQEERDALFSRLESAQNRKVDYSLNFDHTPRS